VFRISRSSPVEYKTASVPVSVTGGGAASARRGVLYGVASPYGGPPDSVGDIVDRGAYGKTLRDRGPRRLALHEHDTKEPIGEALLTDSTDGLMVEMELDLELPGAVKVYAMGRRGYGAYSIGYIPTKKRYVGDVRHLEEIDLLEVSSVVYPAASRAVLTGAKQSDTLKALTRLTREMSDWGRLSSAERRVSGYLRQAKQALADATSYPLTFQDSRLASLEALHTTERGNLRMYAKDRHVAAQYARLDGELEAIGSTLAAARAQLRRGRGRWVA
jgi:HK97 family phage prohead protease